MTNEARFVHNCDMCEYHGQAGRYDIYYCPTCDGGTWLARYGNEIGEYASYPEFVMNYPYFKGQSDSAKAINVFRKGVVMSD